MEYRETIPYPYRGVDLREFTADQVRESIRASYPAREDGAMLAGEQVLARMEMWLLFNSFSRKNKANDDRRKKARIKRIFRRVMCPEQIMIGIKSGEPRMVDKPGFPDKEFDFRAPSVLRFSPDDAGYLRERMVEYADATNDGDPLVTADASDYLEDLLGYDDDPGILRRWRDRTQAIAEVADEAAVEAQAPPE